jgi:phosphoenolpyruvate carboxykinase (ATP)
MVPKTCPNVPAEMLDPRNMWQDKAAYDRAAAELSARFNRNFEKFTLVGREVLEAAPVG